MESPPSRAHRFLRSALLAPGWRAELRRRSGAGSIVPRGAWGASPPRRRYTWRGPLRAVVLHHTQVPAAALAEGDLEGESRYLRELQRSHFERGFDDIGYHFVVVPSGRIFRGRPASALGAHVAGHNTGTVAIALAGDYDLELPSPAALAGAEYVRRQLIAGGPRVPLVGHGDLADRRCPGANLRSYLAQLPPPVAAGTDPLAGIDLDRFQPLWRMHSDAVNLRLLDRWLPDRSRAALKTDLFDEAVGGGLCGRISDAAARVVGIDLSPRVAESARRRHPELRAEVADVRELPFEDGEFDLAVSLSTLDHLSSPAELSRGLREIARVLEPGGTLVLTLDNRANPLVRLRGALPGDALTRLGVVPYPVGVSLGPRRLRAAVEDAGFTVRGETAIMHVPRAPAVAVAGADGRLEPAARRRLLRFLMAFESLERLPTRALTGYFVALRATRT